MDHLRQRREVPIDNYDESEPLDEIEQMEIIRKFQETNNRMNYFWRMLMLTIGVSLSLMKLYTGLFPLQVPMHLPFEGILTPIQIALMEISSSGCFLMSGISFFIKRVC